jgi:flagellar hook-basal body complex protein FliE
MTRIDTGSVMAMRNAILQQNSALQKAASGADASPLGGAGGTKEAGFAGALKSAVTSVNALQAQSGAITESYERGETTDIAAVMLSREQASVGFQATLQVRNKLLAAYKDIMSMPV